MLKLGSATQICMFLTYLGFVPLFRFVSVLHHHLFILSPNLLEKFSHVGSQTILNNNARPLTANLIFQISYFLKNIFNTMNSKQFTEQTNAKQIHAVIFDLIPSVFSSNGEFFVVVRHISHKVANFKP